MLPVIMIVDEYKPVADRDHEVLGMGSVGEYKRTGIKYQQEYIMYPWHQLHHYKG
jgi:hypothetical protein